MTYLTVAEVQQDQARKLTALNAREARLTGGALSLNDPRDIVLHIAGLALSLQLAALMEGGARGADTADALAAQCIAYRLALARVETLDVTSGDTCDRCGQVAPTRFVFEYAADFCAPCAANPQADPRDAA